MIELFEKLIAVLKQGTLPIMLPLVLTCLGIGIIAVNRCLYLYDPRILIGFWFPPLRKKLQRAKDGVALALDDYLNEPGPRTLPPLIEALHRYESPYTRFLLRVLQAPPVRSKVARDYQIEEASVMEEIGIERGMAMLGTLAKAAPLMGLLGTVTGMIATFGAMMVASTSDPRALTAGISMALIATNVGLVVSLPGVIAMGLLSRRAKTLQEEIRLASMRLRGPQRDEQKDGKVAA